MCEFGVVSKSQAARFFYNDVASRAEYRFKVLREAGLIRTSTDSRWAGTVGWTTGKGARRFGEVVGAPGSGQVVVPAGGWPGDRLVHRLAAGEIGMEYQAAGRTVISERLIRRLETLPAGADEAFVKSLGGVRDAQPATVVGQRARWLSVPVGQEGSAHWADLIVVAGGRMLPVEVELTPKPTRDWKRILRAYRDAPEVFGQVVYLCTPRVRRRLVGYPDMVTGDWVDGIAQEVSLLPRGEGRPPVMGPGARLIVQDFDVEDERLMYVLDMREYADAPMTFAEWQRLRVAWVGDDENGKAAGVEWWTWWGQRRWAAAVRGR